MKKKIFGVIVVAAIAVAAGWNTTQTNNSIELSNLASDNVEALADPRTQPDPYKDKKWDRWYHQGENYYGCSPTGNQTCIDAGAV